MHMVQVAALSEDWRDFFKERIQRIGTSVHHPTVQLGVLICPFILREKIQERKMSFRFTCAGGWTAITAPSSRPVSDRSIGDSRRRRTPGGAILLISDVARVDHYRVTIRKVGLASTHFHDRFAVGDRIEVKAPAGTFTIDEGRQGRPVVLIGGVMA